MRSCNFLINCAACIYLWNLWNCTLHNIKSSVINCTCTSSVITCIAVKQVKNHQYYHIVLTFRFSIHKVDSLIFQYAPKYPQTWKTKLPVKFSDHGPSLNTVAYWTKFCWLKVNGSVYTANRTYWFCWQYAIILVWKTWSNALKS